jgi:hypothetical protein
LDECTIETRYNRGNFVRLLVMVEGIHFKGRFDDKGVRVGFYANRAVEAAAVESIDRSALFELMLTQLEEAQVSTTPRSKMWISCISERSADDSRQFGGFSFYPQQSWFMRAVSKLFH